MEPRVLLVLLDLQEPLVVQVLPDSLVLLVYLVAMEVLDQQAPLDLLVQLDQQALQEYKVL
jgi:hypothetical protein